MMLTISQASIQSINAVFSYLFQTNAQFVFWIRSADYERQLYVSPTYEAIWKRPRENLYKNPESFCDTILQEDRDRSKTEQDARKELNGTNLTLFRVYTPNRQLRWIKDYSFILYDDNGLAVAIAGFGECVTEKEWNILQENPNEKNIELNVMNTFVEFTKNRYKIKEFSHPIANMFGISEKQTIYINDLITALTQREFQCLVCLMNDMSVKEIARINNISPRTVESYLMNIKMKADSRTNLELINKVVGVIDKPYTGIIIL